MNFFQLRDRRDPHIQAARLSQQFVLQNRALLTQLDSSINVNFDGSEVQLVLQTGSMIGAIPLISPVTAHRDHGLVVQPRFAWAGIGPMLAEMGWRVVPAPLRLPMLLRSERRVPPWVLSVMILARFKALLDSMDRRFDMVSEDRPAPKGSVNWSEYAARRVTNARFTSVPCAFPDLRDDRLLKGAVRYGVERQIVSLETQKEHGAFVHQLIDFGRSLLRRVNTVPAYIPSSNAFAVWMRRPMISASLLEGIQAIEWTVDERGLAGLSDLEGVPWRMPMDHFFEAWVELVFFRLAQRTGGQLRVGRKRETIRPIVWEPPFLGSQRWLQPDLWIEWASSTLIIDAKYKRHFDEIHEQSWRGLGTELREQHREDLFQVLAYANLACTPNVIACLAYPTSRERWESLRERGRLFHRAEITVENRSISLWLTAIPMAVSAERIVDAFLDGRRFN